jgi:hypothetical protein
MGNRLTDNDGNTPLVIGRLGGRVSARFATDTMVHSSAIRPILSVALPPLLLSVVAAIGITWASAGTLGVFIGSLLAVTVLVPPMVLAVRGWRGRVVTVMLSVAPPAVAWLLTAQRTGTTVGEWVASTGVLLAYALALGGIAAGVRLTRMSDVVSAALTVILGLVWLTWPIWLSPTWDGEASAAGVNRLVAVHPALSVSLGHLGHWAEQSLAYHLTDLNQNVSYHPPRSVGWCVSFHALLGALLIGLAGALAGRGNEAPHARAGLDGIIAAPDGV